MNPLEKSMIEINKHQCTLLYLGVSGSHMYGTNTPESDHDYRGTFLPSRQSCLVGDAPKHLKVSSKEDKNQPNTKEDVDIDLWSLQYWLSLIRKGDTGAIELLFVNDESLMYASPLFKRIQDDRQSLFDLK